MLGEATLFLSQAGTFRLRCADGNGVDWTDGAETEEDEVRGSSACASDC